MPDTCSLSPPYGDPWPSCLLPSQKEKRGEGRGGEQEGVTRVTLSWALQHEQESAMQGAGEAPGQRAQLEQMCTACPVQSSQLLREKDSTVKHIGKH